MALVRLVRAALVLTALAVGGGGTGVEAQISPGPLAQPHGALEGTLRCRECHGAGEKSAMSRQCATCHREIAWLAERRRGLHGRDPAAACASCHPDHAGRDFDLVAWEEGSADGFDHRRAGWPLVESHAKVACRDCHTPKLARSPSAALSPREGEPPEWIGLEQACAGCHADPHRGALAGNCLECHDQREWSPAPRFSHDSTRYPLTGSHAKVGCDACHAPSAPDAPPMYRGLEYRECSACHADPHRGGLGPRCTDCHTTAGFTTIDPRRFDHARTRYPLRGRHASVKCEGCHDFSRPAGRKPAFATCGSCHKDPHAGEATLAGKPADCGACHGLAGFVPANFSVARHAETRYPLEGRHRQVSCSGCHARRAPARGTVMRPPAARCGDCHADDHGGQLARRPGGSECGSCHTVRGWTPSTFDAPRHASLALPLLGRHAAADCTACHGARRKGLRPLPAAHRLGKARVALILPEKECADCHLDPHRGRYAAGGAASTPQGCVECHDAERFRPSTVTVEAHGAFSLPLEGAHRAVPCPACHENQRPAGLKAALIALAAPGATVDYTLSARSCAGCHETPHDRQFDGRAGGAACETCHGTDAFRPADRFDHDRDAAFPLRGAHARVACERCHASDGTGRPVRYRPVSGECSSCHTDAGDRS